MFPCDLVVTSCASYAATTLPVLFESLVQAGLERFAPRIVVVVAQSSESSTEDVEWHAPGSSSAIVQYTQVRVPYAAEALAGLVCVAETDVVRTPWFLYVQDCSFVGPTFFEKAARAYANVCSEDLDVVKLADRFSMSVGFYRTDFVRSEAVRNGLAGVKIDGARSDDDVRLLKYHTEDFAFGLADEDRTGVLGFRKDATVVDDQFRYRPECVRRVVEKYPWLDYYKLKSWWGQTNDVGTRFLDDGKHIINFPVGP